MTRKTRLKVLLIIGIAALVIGVFEQLPRDEPWSWSRFAVVTLIAGALLFLCALSNGGRTPFGPMFGSEDGLDDADAANTTDSRGD